VWRHPACRGCKMQTYSVGAGVPENSGSVSLLSSTHSA
jgi:hypothetical protein